MNHTCEPWIQTYSGKKFWLNNPTEETICIEDIAHSLSMICRYNGHSPIEKWHKDLPNQKSFSGIAEGWNWGYAKMCFLDRFTDLCNSTLVPEPDKNVTDKN